MLYWRKLFKQEAKSQPWIDKYDSVKSQTNPDVTIISELYDDLPNVHDLPDIRMAMVTAVKRKYTSEASPPKLRLDGASAVRFRGFSFFLSADFLLSPYDLSLSFGC